MIRNVIHYVTTDTNYTTSPTDSTSRTTFDDEIPEVITIHVEREAFVEVEPVEVERENLMREARRRSRELIPPASPRGRCPQSNWKGPRDQRSRFLRREFRA